MKHCAQCHQDKDESEFYKNAIRCKTCISENNKAKWASMSVEERRETNARKERRVFNPKFDRHYHYQFKYNLSIDDVRKKIALQGGRCAICKEKHVLCVDHDHETGVIRSMLCSRCNRLLGVARDNVAYLQSCIDYLKSHSRG